MKSIEAIIGPAAFERVYEALQQRGVSGLTVSEVAAFGQGPRRVSSYRGASYTIDCATRLRLEIVASDFEAGPIAHTIAQAARIGSNDDGLVTIRSLEEVVHVRPTECPIPARGSTVASVCFGERRTAEPLRPELASRSL